MQANHGNLKIKIGLVQINNSFSGQNYLPLSAGLLQAYAEKNARDPNSFEFLLPIYCRLPIEKAVNQLLEADVIGFSAYVWNIRISLEIAKAIKREKPQSLIVFGGPQVPDCAEGFLKENPFIDIACHGEGERVFLSILENFPSGRWNSVSSISYQDEKGTFVNNPKADRLRDLSLIPSPFLEGVFDPLIHAYPNEQWLALWETNRGCPFSCTFCDWGSAIAAKIFQFDMERLLKEVDWFSEKKIEFIFCCDANFGILPRDLDIAKYVANIKQRRGYPHALSVQNTKNSTDRAYNVQKILADSGLNKGVSISVQSVDQNTLKSIKRQNISSKSFQELQRRFTQDGVETYTDVILGLPGETYDSFTQGVSQLMEEGQHNRIQFNNLAILPNAEMGDPAYQKQHGLVAVDSEIINIHGSIAETKGDITEIQQLVVATHAMPREDWAKVRAFCWMTALLHFDKVLQIPFILLHEIYSIPYRTLIEAFLEKRLASFPVLSKVREFFIEKAKDIQNGGHEYCHSKEWLDIWWPADEYMMIKLCTEGELNLFFEEAEGLIAQQLETMKITPPPPWLHEAIELNKNLIKLPFQSEDLEVTTSFNIWEFYQSVLLGKPIAFQPQHSTYHINRTGVSYVSWEEWCREVIWYGNKKGAYLYGRDQIEPQLAGHY